MFELYSESARQIIFLARYEADRLKSEAIDLQHILLALIEEDQGEGRSLLRKALGVAGEEGWIYPPQPPIEGFLDPEVAKKLKVEFSQVGTRVESSARRAHMPLSAGSKKALLAASEHAEGSTVTPLHLLWGVLAAEEGGVVSQSLVANGITQESVDGAIRRRDVR